MEKFLLLKLGPNGEREIEAFGFNTDGNNIKADCRQASQMMENILGKVTDVKAKTDWSIVNGEQARREKNLFGIDATKHCG